MPLGYYIVGTDIAAGKYTTYVEAGKSGTVRIYDSYSTYQSDGKYNYFKMRNGNWNVTFSIDDGQVFVVQRGDIYMTKAETTMLTFD